MKRTLALLILSFAFTAVFPGQALCDIAGPPPEEIIKSPNGQYYLHSVPKGEWLEEGYYIEWTFGKTDGPVYFTKKAFYASDIQIADDGEHFVAAGNYVHNMLSEDSAEHEGLWFYDRQGNLISHVNRPRCYFPERSVSSLWWFENGIISGNTYLLTLKDGSTRRYELSTGRLKWYRPSIGFILYFGTIGVYVIFIGSRLLLLGRYIWLKRSGLSSAYIWDEFVVRKPKIYKTMLSAFTCTIIVSLSLLFLDLTIWAITSPEELFNFKTYMNAFEIILPVAGIILLSSSLFFTKDTSYAIRRSITLVIVLLGFGLFMFKQLTSLTFFYLLPFSASTVLLLPTSWFGKLKLRRV